MNRLSVADQRAEDLDLLNAIREHVEGADGRGGTSEDPTRGFSNDEADAFASMLDRLSEGQTMLTEKQRSWASSRAEQVGLTWGDPSRRNAHVPRGAEVETPAVLRVLPKKPPQRRNAP